MNNTTNHVTNTIFSKKNEELVVAALIRLVDHITAKPLPKDQAAWEASLDPSHQVQAPLDTPAKRHAHRQQEHIADLKRQLAEANAKISNRL